MFTISKQKRRPHVGTKNTSSKGNTGWRGY